MNGDPALEAFAAMLDNLGRGVADSVPKLSAHLLYIAGTMRDEAKLRKAIVLYDAVEAATNDFNYLNGAPLSRTEREVFSGFWQNNIPYSKYLARGADFVADYCAEFERLQKKRKEEGL